MLCLIITPIRVRQIPSDDRKFLFPIGPLIELHPDRIIRRTVPMVAVVMQPDFIWLAVAYGVCPEQRSVFRPIAIYDVDVQFSSVGGLFMVIAGAVVRGIDNVEVHVRVVCVPRQRDQHDGVVHVTI